MSQLEMFEPDVFEPDAAPQPERVPHFPEWLDRYHAYQREQDAAGEVSLNVSDWRRREAL